MHAQFRFGKYLIKYRLTLLVGSDSRCFASISCLTLRPFGRNVLSIHPHIDPDSPEGIEAIAFQLGMLEAHPGLMGRMRFTADLQQWPNVAQFYRAKDYSRAWRAGSVIAVTDSMLAIARRRRLDHEGIADLCGVTRRLVEWRDFDARLTDGKLICAPRLDAGLDFQGRELLWSEV